MISKPRKLFQVPVPYATYIIVKLDARMPRLPLWILQIEMHQELDHKQLLHDVCQEPTRAGLSSIAPGKIRLAGTDILVLHALLGVLAHIVEAQPIKGVGVAEVGLVGIDGC